ncbi:J domain-containing protein [Novosphingobium sp. 9]|uniref:J domain-containing protein n=1 Tax=Novosphingobium sp. 9 TaxID=2025349 RepID=UPI0021B6B2A9|nr:J domain-containing protein [Novosphingobium sp. 9]
MRHDRFHGRHRTAGRECSWPGCEEAGEFRAPGSRAPGFDGPGDYRWMCLEHVRQFNSGYDYFEGMAAEEILRAQSPIHGWDTHSRAFRADAGVDGVPRWADFSDPLEAISGRARAHVRRRQEEMARAEARPSRFSPGEWQAMETLGLEADADRKTLRLRYTRLLRQYHPDHNGGDRSHEARLQQVVEAYQTLRGAAAFRAEA